MKAINLFYSEPDPDRWIKFDRYPRRVIRTLLRGNEKPGGVMMIVLNLMAGLDKLGISYRFNDYQYIKKHPKELACIIGKPHLLFEREWKNPILFGAGIYSHPIECPDLFERYPHVKHCLVPGDWMVKMFEPYYPHKVSAWPTGIDTEKWAPSEKQKEFDFLIYNKIRWDYDRLESELLNPIKKVLRTRGLTFQEIRYGYYKPEELQEKLKTSKAVIFLCEHETQGIAYQQVLACDIPILAWDRGGFWQDPYYYPQKTQYQPVSSVPYWDDRCGLKFFDYNDFEEKLAGFLELLKLNSFNPRQYILENLTLEVCARKYLNIYQQISKDLNQKNHSVK